MRLARLAQLLTMCLLLIAPSYGQTLMGARRQLLQAEEFVRNRDAQGALNSISEGLEILRLLELEATPLASSFFLSQARAYRLLSDDAGAVGSFEKALAIIEPLEESQGRRYQLLLLEYGDYQRERHRYEESIALYSKALELERQSVQPEELQTVKTLHNLACAYRDKGDLEQAFEIFTETLARKERLLAADDASLAITLNEFGGLCRLLGRFDLAETYLQRALRIRQAQKESSPASYARVLNNLSLVKQAVGERREALRLIQESYQLFLKMYGPTHAETVVPRMSLAQAHSSLGELEQAEQLYGEALAVARSQYGADSLEVATVIHNLGTLMLEMNDLEKAKLYLEQALATRRHRLSANHQDLGPTLINLATTHRKAGRYDQALELYREALSVGQAALGQDHPDLAYTLDLMAGVPSLATKPDEVLELTRRAYEIRRKAFGPKAAVTANSVYSLALLSHQRGELEEAQKLFEISLTVFQKELGPDHPFTGRAAYRLGALALEQGDRKRALAYADVEARALLATTEEIFSFASERQRLAYSSRLRPYDLPASLGAAGETATALLRYKGAVLDSIMEDLSLARRSPDPQVQARVEALLRVRERLSNSLGESSQDIQADSELARRNSEKLALLREELEKLEASVARDGYSWQEVRRAFRVTPTQVLKALPKRSVLIELVRYGHLLDRGAVEDSYGAVILAPGREPVWIYLGPAREIEAMTWRYKRFVRGRGVEAGGPGEILQELYGKVWQPLEKALPEGTETILISPDSELSFVSFATLVDDNENFVGQRFDLLYVASGRDLLRSIPAEGRHEAAFFGDPVFTDRSVEPLPFTRLECRKLTQLFENFPGWQVHEFLGASASESQVKSVSRPGYLHIATHGYFEAQRDSSGSDPMAASGLILSAGPGEDGYLTAGEVSLLDLTGTTLVTLSACDTGLGLAQAGEGVLGLRRGFLKAGARHLVMTLWPVPDDTTASFMQDFVARAQKIPPPLALAQVQREWLTRLSKEHSPGRAVREVGPFVLNLQERWTTVPGF